MPAKRVLYHCLDCGNEATRPVNAVRTVRCPECQKKFEKNLDGSYAQRRRYKDNEKRRQQKLEKSICAYGGECFRLIAIPPLDPKVGTPCAYDNLSDWVVGATFSADAIELMERSHYLDTGMIFQRNESGKGLYEYVVGRNGKLSRGVLIIPAHPPTPLPSASLEMA